LQPSPSLFPTAPDVMDMPNQHALLIRVAGDTVHGLDTLNDHLSDGWRIVETTPLGGGHATETVALVVIEERHRADAPSVPVAERETAPTEEEIVPPGVDPVEGDGATPGVDPDIDTCNGPSAS